MVNEPAGDRSCSEVEVVIHLWMVLNPNFTLVYQRGKPTGFQRELTALGLSRTIHVPLKSREDWQRVGCAARESLVYIHLQQHSLSLQYLLVYSII
jgi:hypothetical protein